MKDSSLDDELDKRLRSMFNDLTEEQFVVRIKELITKREREARIDELKELIKPRECYRPSCKQEHTLLRKKYVKDRIKELNTSEGGKQ